MLIHEPLSFFYRNSSDTDHVSRSVKFPVLENSDPSKRDRDFQRREFRELITRQSETVLPLFLSYSFLLSSLLFGIKIYKTFYRSSIINAGLNSQDSAISMYVIHINVRITRFLLTNTLKTALKISTRFKGSEFSRTGNLRSKKLRGLCISILHINKKKRSFL